MIPVRVRPRAQEELQDAIRFYDADAPGLGGEFLAEIERVATLIQEHPELGARYTPRTRRLLLRRFPYAILYQVRSDHLLIIAFAHLRRRPLYWTQRDRA